MSDIHPARPIAATGSDNRIDVAEASLLARAAIAVEGNRNVLSIADGCRIYATIKILGDDNRIEIGAKCMLRGEITIKTSGSALFIGEGTTSMNLRLSMHEAEKIRIGRDCMFSSSVWMDVSDMHSILDLDTGRRVNPPRPIVIADHVWIGHGVIILKGSTINSGTVIGAGAVVTGEIPANCVAAGNPARPIKHNITWDRRRLPLTP